MNIAALFKPFLDALEPRFENVIVYALGLIMLGAAVVAVRTEWNKRRARS